VDAPARTEVSLVNEVLSEPEEDGFTSEQFSHALKLASKRIAQKARKAESAGTLGVEATKKLMDAALDAKA
jgi:hypothetical protein